MLIEKIQVSGGVRQFMTKLTNGRVGARSSSRRTSTVSGVGAGGVGSATVHATEDDELDVDVQAERDRVDNGLANDDMIVCRHLRLVYPARASKGSCGCCPTGKKQQQVVGADGGAASADSEEVKRTQPKSAVRDLTFGIPRGECFGFLGVNGAGKTSALRMLSADAVSTAGTATLQGLDIKEQQEEVRHIIGYCPQFDALLPNLTGRQTLTFYANLKGVQTQNVVKYVDALLERCGIAQYADRPCGGYSGGNKRKLSLGVALIGNPPIVFLDEPSTGMDPKARRDMWSLISSTMAGRSVILTTHSMEECEALCSRIGKP
jgi:ABC-type Na+ transport system ATPase subunit NatA